eukprot:g12151.t1
MTDVTRPARGKQIPMIFGIVDGSASSSQGLKIGEPELPGSFGAACIRRFSGRRKSGKIVQCGNSCGPAPGVCDGDVVRLRIEEGGRVIFFKGATQISSCTVGGKGEFRVAVTLHEEGQRVEILEESVSESLARCADPRKGVALASQALNSTLRSKSDDKELKECQAEAARWASVAQDLQHELEAPEKKCPFAATMLRVAFGLLVNCTEMCTSMGDVISVWLNTGDVNATARIVCRDITTWNCVILGDAARASCDGLLVGAEQTVTGLSIPRTADGTAAY